MIIGYDMIALISTVSIVLSDYLSPKYYIINSDSTYCSSILPEAYNNIIIFFIFVFNILYYNIQVCFNIIDLISRYH